MIEHKCNYDKSGKCTNNKITTNPIPCPIYCPFEGQESKQRFCKGYKGDILKWDYIKGELVNTPLQKHETLSDKPVDRKMIYEWVETFHPNEVDPEESFRQALLFRLREDLFWRPRSEDPCNGCSCMLTNNLGCPEMKHCPEYLEYKLTKEHDQNVSQRAQERILNELTKYHEEEMENAERDSKIAYSKGINRNHDYWFMEGVKNAHYFTLTNKIKSLYEQI